MGRFALWFCCRALLSAITFGLGPLLSVCSANEATLQVRGVAAERDLTLDEQRLLQQQAREQIRACASRGAKTPKDMLACSGYLVGLRDYAKCMSDNTDAVCLVTKVCGVGPKEEVLHVCNVVSDTELAKWSGARLYPKDLTASKAVAAVLHTNIPLPNQQQAKRMATCQKTYEKDEKGRAKCLADEFLTPSQKELRDCVKEHVGDEVAKALHCMPNVKDLTLTPADLTVLRCGFQKPDKAQALTCLLPESKEPLSRMLECTPGQPSFEVLGPCLYGASQVSAKADRAREQAACFSRLDRANPALKDMRECLSKAGLRGRRLEEAMTNLERANKCAEGLTDEEGPDRLAKCVPDGAKRLAEAKVKAACLQGKEFSEALKCAESEKLNALQDCYAKHKDNRGALVTQCSSLGEQLDPVVVGVTACAANVAHSPVEDLSDKLKACDGAFGSDEQRLAGKALAAYKRYHECRAKLDKGKDDPYAQARFATCLAKAERLPALMDCALRTGSQTTAALFAACGKAFGAAKVPGVEYALKIYQCHEVLDRGADAVSCASFFLHTKEAALLRCLAKTDKAEALLCVAGPHLPPDVTRVGTCAVQAASGDLTAAGGCAARIVFPGLLKGLNPEWQAAAECAATSGGEPVTTATCTGTRLAIMELTKCMSGGVGKRNGCFGPNNTIVRFYAAYYKALTKPSWGRNNDIRKGLGQFDRLALQPVWDVFDDAGSYVDERIRALPKLPKCC